MGSGSIRWGNPQPASGTEEDAGGLGTEIRCYACSRLGAKVPGPLEKETTMEIVTRARLTCPRCGAAQEADMPTDACQHFYECVRCKAVLKPKQGDCCVFCSYADRPCPPKQAERAA